MDELNELANTLGLSDAALGLLRARRFKTKKDVRSMSPEELQSLNIPRNDIRLLQIFCTSSDLTTSGSGSCDTDADLDTGSSSSSNPGSPTRSLSNEIQIMKEDIGDLQMESTEPSSESEPEPDPVIAAKTSNDRTPMVPNGYEQRWLQCLEQLKLSSSTIPEDLAENMKRFDIGASLGTYDKMQQIFQDIQDTLVYQHLAAFQRDTAAMLTILDQYRKMLKGQFSEMERDFIAGVSNLIRALQHSIFGDAATLSWLSKKEFEYRQLDDLLRGCDFVSRWSKVQEFARSSPDRYVVCLALNDALFSDPSVVEFTRCHGSRGVLSDMPTQDLQSQKWWLTESSLQQQVLTQLNRFIEFAKENKHTKFALEFTEANEYLTMDEISGYLLFERGAYRRFDLPGPPQTLEVIQAENKAYVVRWTRPLHGADFVNEYHLSFRPFPSSKDREKHAVVQATEEPRLVLPALSSKKKRYRVTVRSVCCVGRTTAKQWWTAAEEMTKTATPLSSEKFGSSSLFTIYRFPSRVVYSDAMTKVRKITVGKKPDRVDEAKSILIMGETGTGKSTLINSMANFFYGVDYEDHFRFELIGEKPLQSQAQSVTTWITVYVLYRAGNKRGVGESLTIIDTPGLNDTMQRDEEITDQLSNFLLNPDTDKKSDGVALSTLSAIGIAISAPSCRVTPEKLHVFDKVFSLFGRDLKENLFWLVTHSDTENPEVVRTIAQGKWPSKRCFILNNAYLLTPPVSELSKPLWDMNAAGMELFFKTVRSMEPVRLDSTKELLRERENLKTLVKGLLPQITKCLEQQNQRCDLLAKLDAIDSQSDSDGLKVPHREFVTKLISPSDEQGVFGLICTECQKNCHVECTDYMIRIGWSRWFCTAITVAGFCRVCPGKCYWTRHKLSGDRFEDSEVIVERTLAQLKAFYSVTRMKGEKQLDYEARVAAQSDQLAARIEEAVTETRRNLRVMLQRVAESQQRLDRIALWSTSSNASDYIQKLIDAELAQKAPDWDQRIMQLEQARSDIEEFRAQGGQLPDDDEGAASMAEKVDSSMRALVSFGTGLANRSSGIPEKAKRLARKFKFMGS
ncbi:hypothetical protein BV898_18408 [Hypsibius exemplaris]|uniref:Fibronectin type-III domain-containing protein n=1 Tax=Hypsibius exemplaris TaxID=2072580 RepID=A0A9X6NGV6_HYPEX|nr:hypothetical protein BV898_18408 [Hypsibius exemplaris]